MKKGKRYSKLMSLLLAVCMVFTMMPAVAWAADLPVSGGSVNIEDRTVGGYSLQTLDVYLQGSFEPVSILSAAQNGTTIDILLSDDTDPSAALQVGFAGSGTGTISHSGNKCTLSNGTGQMNCKVTHFTNQPNTVTYTINFTVPMGDAYDISLPSGEGYTVTGSKTVYEGGTYSFKVEAAEGYDGSNMVVKVNGEAVTGNNGSYTVENVTENLEITVEGIVKKEVCTITAPTGDGYTFSGSATAYKGEGYTFKITVDNAYNGSNMVVKANGEVVTGSNGNYTIAAVNKDTAITVEGIVRKEVCSITPPAEGEYTFTGAENVYKGEDYTFTVKANAGYAVTVKVNDEEITGTNGSYTVAAVSEDLTITVDVQRAPLPDKELTVTDNVIDITDKTLYSRSSYYAKATNIKIEGVSVSEAYEDNTTVYVLLPYDTGDSASVSVSFGTDLNRCTVSGHEGSVTLENGEGILTMNVTGTYMSSLKGTVTYTLIFIRELPPTEVPVCAQNTDTAEVWKDRPLEINLKKYFTGAGIYYLVEGENKTPIDAVYSFTSNQAGKHVLTFTASNLIGECKDPLTITVTVKEIEHGVYIGHATSNGSLECVTFTDGEGNPIEGLNAVYANKTITVSLPKTYPLDGKVTATFERTANSSGLPFLSSSNAFNQGAGSRTDVFTNTLSSGAAARTAYLYNSVPKATSNVYDTFTIKYAIVNELPTLASGQTASAEAAITAGEVYTLDLSNLFTDADGDALTYLVSVNGAAVVAADAAYSYTTDTAGTYTLVFTANDGKSTSTDTYTVNLTVNNSAEKDSMTVHVPDGLNPKFYVSSGYGTDGIEILGDEVTADNGENGIYTLHYPKNAELLSVRTDTYGGMAFRAEEGTSIALRCVKLSVVDYENKDAVSANTVTYDGHTAPAGTDGWLLVVGGSYTYTAVPENTTDFKTAEKTEILAEGTEPYIAELMLGINNAITITATTGAVARLYNYDKDKYYYATEYTPKITEDNGDGTTTYYFSASGDCMIYHVSMPGKITKAGYLGWNQKSVTVTFSDDDKAASYRLDDYSGTGEDNAGMTEDSVLLNINGQNNLAMSVGESRTLKAYRAWEIIKISYQNYIITPNFHFNILQGNDVISLTEKDSPSVGEGDWKTLSALKEGTAIIEVTYDALELAKGNDIQATQYSGTYGASDPARTGLAVIQVGGHDDSVKFGIESKASKGSTTYNAANGKAWDAEFDTLYFTGASGKLTFAPTADSAISKVEVSGDKGTTWTELTADAGKYTADIVSGNNIIKVTTETGTAYQVVRGDKITVRYVEVEDKSDKDDIIEAGETIRIYFDGLHQPIPKMSGNYNPSFGGNTDGDSVARIKYTFDGKTIQNNGTHQYNFITVGNNIEVTIPEAAEGTSYTLTDGYIGVGILGLTNFFDGGDSHRNIPDSGCSTRDSRTTFHTRTILPELTITVGQTTDPNNAPTVVPGSVTEASIEAGKYYPVPLGTIFTDKDGDLLSYTVSVNDGEETTVSVDYKYFAETEGTYKLKFTASDGKAAAEHTITLTVTKKEEKPQEPTGPQFNLPENQIQGYVTVSFEDFAERVEGEKGLTYPNPLGTIISATRVPYAEGDTIADVTLRLLDAYGIGAEYSGSTKSGFYLGAIKNFEVDNTPYSSLGEFDAGSGSGWMITHNGTFIDQGASQFTVKSGDVIQWQYTCQLGKDIGDPFYDDKLEEGEVTDVTTNTGAAGGSTEPVTTTTPTEVIVSGSTATATITKENVTETLKQAAENKSTEIVVQVSANDTKGAAKIEVKLDTQTVKDIVDDTDAALTVKTENGTVTLDRETLKTVTAEAKGSIVTLEIVEVAKPTPAHKEAAGENGHVIQLVIKSGDKVISVFNEGKATITVAIPMKLDGKRLAAIHIGDDGKIEHLKGHEVTVNGLKHYRFNTPHFSTFALIDADEIGLEMEALNADEVKALLEDLTPVVRSVKTAKGNVKVTLKLDKADKAIIEELEAAGFTVKYNFYRSTKKASKYKSMLIKDGKTYTNTKGKKGTMYYYKARVQVYDAEGNLVARTALKQCRYANRKWTK